MYTVGTRSSSLPVSVSLTSVGSQCQDVVNSVTSGSVSLLVVVLYLIFRAVSLRGLLCPAHLVTTRGPPLAIILKSGGFWRACEQIRWQLSPR